MMITNSVFASMLAIQSQLCFFVGRQGFSGLKCEVLGFGVSALV